MDQIQIWPGRAEVDVNFAYDFGALGCLGCASWRLQLIVRAGSRLLSCPGRGCLSNCGPPLPCGYRVPFGGRLHSA